MNDKEDKERGGLHVMTTYSYDKYGDEAQVATSGLYSKTLVRHRDAYGRDLGHTPGWGRVRLDCHSKLPQVRQAKLGRTNSGRSYIVKKSTYD